MPTFEIIDDIPDRAMVIFAHADDGELGAGGATIAWANSGCEITFVCCTDGGSGSNDRSQISSGMVPLRVKEQRAAANVAGVERVEFLAHPDGGLEDDTSFRGEVVRMIRKYRPHTIFCHDPHQKHRFQHRDHRMVGTVVLDAVYPYARDHLHFPEHVVKENLNPHKVHRVLMWGSNDSNVIIDTTKSIEKQIEALACHKSQTTGLASSKTIFDQIRNEAKKVSVGYSFEYGQCFRQLVDMD